MTSKKILLGLSLLFFFEYLLLCLVARSPQEDTFVIPVKIEHVAASAIHESLSPKLNDSPLTNFHYDQDTLDNSLAFQLQLHTDAATFDIQGEKNNDHLTANCIRTSEIPFLKGGIFLLSNKKEPETKLVKETLDKIAGY